jgi:HEAT repeat protein
VNSKQEAFAFSALQFILENALVDQARNATKELLNYGKNPKLVEVLALGLKNKDTRVRKSAARALSQVDVKMSKSAITALSTENLNDEQVGNTIGLAMQNLYVKLGFAEAAKEISGTNENAKLKAISALGKLYLDPKEKKNQPKILAELDKAANHSDPKVKAEAARAYGEMGGDVAKNALINLSKSDAIEIRRMVAYGLGFFGTEVGEEFLSKQLADTDPILLVYTARSIAKIKSIKSAELLIDEKYINHENIKVRRAVLKSLADVASLFDKKKQGLLISLCGARLEGDTDVKVKMNAAKALGNVKADTAIDILTPNIQAENINLKLTIVKALINHNSSSAVKSLELAIEDKDDQTRAKVIALLDQISNEDAKKALKEILNKRKDKESNTEIKSSIEKRLNSL